MGDRVGYEIRSNPLYIGDRIAQILNRKGQTLGLERSSSCDLILPSPVQLEPGEARVGCKEVVRAVLQVRGAPG
jgi:hypothetical protein